MGVRFGVRQWAISVVCCLLASSAFKVASSNCMCVTCASPSPEPSFVRVQLIPDSAERNDDKLYFFFREQTSEVGQRPKTLARIGRICLVGVREGVCV